MLLFCWLCGLACLATEWCFGSASVPGQIEIIGDWGCHAVDLPDRRRTGSVVTLVPANVHIVAGVPAGIQIFAVFRFRCLHDASRRTPRGKQPNAPVPHLTIHRILLRRPPFTGRLRRPLRCAQAVYLRARLQLTAILHFGSRGTWPLVESTLEITAAAPRS